MSSALPLLLLLLGVHWHVVRPGVWKSEMAMAADGPLSVVRAIAIRIDPARQRFDLASRDDGTRWTIDDLAPHSVVAFNAGQFQGAWPWGWIVQDGAEEQEPGAGTLAMSFVVDSSGKVALLTPDELPRMRGHVRLALQSYPALLVGEGKMPRELTAAGLGVDLDHRDSRLALGILEDSSVVVVITRLSALGGPGETFPYGPTVPEMAAYMRSIGCRRAMLLDGGLSSQLAFRDADGQVKRWKNWRAVPLGMVVTPKLVRSEGGSRRFSLGVSPD
jgi:exopolysaccharide biosynthesis protein